MLEKLISKYKPTCMTVYDRRCRAVGAVSDKICTLSTCIRNAHETMLLLVDIKWFGLLIVLVLNRMPSPGMQASDNFWLLKRID